MLTKQLSPWTAAPFAIVVWLLSAFVPVGVLVIALFIGAAAFVQPALTFHFEKGQRGKISFTWNYKDWIGLVILILVIVGLLEGEGPKELLALIMGGKA
jgi:hypothetical protein